MNSLNYNRLQVCWFTPVKRGSNDLKGHLRMNGNPQYSALLQPMHEGEKCVCVSVCRGGGGEHSTVYFVCRVKQKVCFIS